MPLEERRNVAHKLLRTIHRKLEADQTRNLTREAERRRMHVCGWLHQELKKGNSPLDKELKEDILRCLTRIKISQLRTFLPWMVADPPRMSFLYSSLPPLALLSFPLKCVSVVWLLCCERACMYACMRVLCVLC